MTPLKITFRVSGGLVPPPYPLHLDALLAYRVTKDTLHYLEDEGQPSVDALRALADDLPFARHEQDGEWVWKASAIMPVGKVANSSRFYTQRRDKADYVMRVVHGHVLHGRYKPGAPMTPYQFQIDTLRGVHRNLLGYYPIQHGYTRDGKDFCVELEAWCVGQRDVIEDYLTDGGITHLGSRRRAGHGRIESVTVEEDAAALENWKLRVRPWAMREDDAPIQAAWRAPYWANENRGQAFCPLSVG